MDKNAVWCGRNAAYIALKSFLNMIGLLGQKANKTEDSFE